MLEAKFIRLLYEVHIGGVKFAEIPRFVPVVCLHIAPESGFGQMLSHRHPATGNRHKEISGDFGAAALVYIAQAAIKKIAR